MKKLGYVIFLISFLLFIFSLVIFLYSNKVLEERVIYSSVNVTRSVAGFDLNGTALTFGAVNLGGSMVREIKIDNNFDFPVFIHISADGNIKEVIFYERKVEIGSNSSVSIPFVVSVKNDTKPGFYEGKITFKTKLN